MEMVLPISVGEGAGELILPYLFGQKCYSLPIFLVHLRLWFHFTQKQRLIVNAVVLSPNDAIQIKTNMKKDNLRNEKKFDTGGKNDACGDDKQMFL